MVTDMNGLFYYKKMTNEDLSQWNVGQVTDMSFMCKWATAGVRGCWRGLVCVTRSPLHHLRNSQGRRRVWR